MSKDKTFAVLYKNDVWAIEISVIDSTGADFTFDAAYYTVEDSNGNVVVSRRGAMVVTNKMSFICDTTVTATPGKYFIIWEVIRSTNPITHVAYPQAYIRSHRTELNVKDV